MDTTKLKTFSFSKLLDWLNVTMLSIIYIDLFEEIRTNYHANRLILFYLSVTCCNSVFFSEDNRIVT